MKAAFWAVVALLDQAHLFVPASATAKDGDQEGTPVSLLDAQASGLPVVSTRHSGIPEIVQDGESGLLAPERDVNALADRLLSDGASRTLAGFRVPWPRQYRDTLYLDHVHR